MTLPPLLRHPAPRPSSGLQTLSVRTTLEIESQWPVALIFLRLLFDVRSREISRFQFVRGEVLPDLDVDAVVTRNTKQTLRVSHH